MYVQCYVHVCAVLRTCMCSVTYMCVQCYVHVCAVFRTCMYTPLSRHASWPKGRSGPWSCCCAPSLLWCRPSWLVYMVHSKHAHIQHAANMQPLCSHCAANVQPVFIFFRLDLHSTLAILQYGVSYVWYKALWVCHSCSLHLNGIRNTCYRHLVCRPKYDGLHTVHSCIVTALSLHVAWNTYAYTHEYCRFSCLILSACLHCTKNYCTVNVKTRQFLARDVRSQMNIKLSNVHMTWECQRNTYCM